MAVVIKKGFIPLKRGELILMIDINSRNETGHQIFKCILSTQSSMATQKLLKPGITALIVIVAVGALVGSIFWSDAPNSSIEPGSTTELISTKQSSLAKQGTFTSLSLQGTGNPPGWLVPLPEGMEVCGAITGTGTGQGVKTLEDWDPNVTLCEQAQWDAELEAGTNCAENLADESCAEVFDDPDCFSVSTLVHDWSHELCTYLASPYTVFANGSASCTKHCAKYAGGE
jgi:hypothetical protein